jgi:hypothetical protein
VAVVFVVLAVLVALAFTAGCIYAVHMMTGDRHYAEAQPGEKQPPHPWHPELTMPVTAVVAGIRAGKSAQLSADPAWLRVTSDAVSPLWISREEITAIRSGRGLKSGTLRFEVPGRKLHSTWIRPRAAEAAASLAQLGWPVDSSGPSQPPVP